MTQSMTQSKKVDCKNAKDLPPDELLEYSREHLFYEIRMFFGTAAILQGWTPALSETLRMAVVESFAIHTRNLIDFFYTTPGGDDIAARHFFEDGKLPELSSVVTDWPTIRERANKQVAHLTDKRIAGTPPEKVWPMSAICRDMQRVLVEFVTVASPSKLDKRVTDWINSLPPTIMVSSRSDGYATTTCSSTLIRFDSSNAVEWLESAQRDAVRAKKD